MDCEAQGCVATARTKILAGSGPLIVAVTVVVPGVGLFGEGAIVTVVKPCVAAEAFQVAKEVPVWVLALPSVRVPVPVFTKPDAARLFAMTESMIRLPPPNWCTTRFFWVPPEPVRVPPVML